MRLLAPFLAVALAAGAADLRLGIIGTDTSHVIVFTKTFNDPSNPGHIPGAKVVAFYKGGSPDIQSSSSRVDGYAAELKDKWNLTMAPDIASLCGKVDGILLESVDGRKHLAQAREAFKCGKPVFIDKPLAATYEDALEIAKLAKQAGVQWTSASSLRWSEIASTMKYDDAKGAMTWGPGPEEEHHYLDLSWYAIHPVEMLFAIMGPGCVEVSRMSAPDGDVVVGKWANGKIGTVRTGKPYSDYGAVVFRAKQASQSNPKMKVDYGPMLRELVKFFQGGPPPVPNDETLDIFAFMDAAQKSKEQGGRTVKVRKP